MPITVENAPAIASALLALRGETQASLSKKSGIRVANLSVWLRGKKDQVISEKRVTALLECLGVEGGRLKKFAVHEWQINGSITHLRFVLQALVPENQRDKLMVLTERCGFGASNNAFLVPLEKGFAVVKVIETPGFLNNEKLTAETLGFGQFFTVNDYLPRWPSSNLDADEKPDRLANELNHLEKILLEWIRRDAETRGLNTEQLVDMLAQDIPGAKDIFNCWNPGFDELSSVLHSAIKKGVSPKEIAALIAKQYFI